MKVRPCPKCGGVLAASAVAGDEGELLCRGCNSIVVLATLAVAQEADTSDVDLKAVPSGCWVESRDGNAIIGAILRSRGGYVLLVWTLIWNAPVLLMITVWIRTYSSSTSLFCGMLVMPILAAIGVISAMMSIFDLFGKLEVSVGRSFTSVYRGVGSIGWTRSIHTEEAASARIVNAPTEPGDPAQYVIQIGEGRGIRFGSMLPDDRKKWVCVAVDAAIRARSGNARSGNAYR
jgi:hypothetical protein